MKILKKWWFWVIVIVIIGAIGANSSNTKDSQQTSAVSSGDAKASDAPKTAETAKPAENKPTITKAEFDKIENGMTYEQIVEIIGGPGEVLSEVGQKGEQFYTIMYMYTGEGSVGANANFTFQGGKLQGKAQVGLK